MKARRLKIRDAHRSGMTILELITVVIIVAVIMGLIFPTLGALRRSTRGAGGANAVQAAVVAARAFATRDRDGRFIEIGGQPCQPSFGCGDSGAAIVFTPNGDMRIVENTPFAGDENGMFMELSGLSGYIDIAGRDAIRMPENIGVMGVTRNGGVLFLPPPFAMRFDNAGHLVVSNDNTDVVYYDGNGDGVIDTTRDRSNAFDPNEPFNGSGSDDFDLKLWDPYEEQDPVLLGDLHKDHDTGRWPLPFERLEAVLGVVLYDKDDLRGQVTTIGPSFLAADSDSDNQLKGTVAEWLMRNGNVLLFSRYSGTLISEGEGL